jgi:CubicO group peptidase (beta-lactamase class C family)
MRHFLALISPAGRRVLLAFTLALVLGSVGMVSAQETASIPDAQPAVMDDLEPYVDGMVDALLRDHDVPGLLVAVTDGQGDRLLKGYGFADAALSRPVDGERTRFLIGSITKTFIWTSVMILAERGELDLDRDVNDYLVDLQIDEAFDAPVTLRDLMAHRAGFESSFQVFQSSDDDPRSLGQALADTQPRRINPPGSRTSYSNWGSALAAYIVEQVSGQGFAAFIQTELLDPLQMTSTTLVPPNLQEGDWAANMAQGLKRSEGAWETAAFMQIGAFAPAGGMAMTAADMGRWMRFHLNEGELDGVRVLSRSAYEAMRERQFSDRIGAADLAHGFQDYELQGVRVYGHGGSTGNFQSQMLLVPELDLGVFVSKNSGNEGYATPSIINRLLIERELARQNRGQLTGFTEAATSALADYAGKYRNNRRSFSTFFAVTQVGASAEVAVLQEGKPALLVSRGDEMHRYYPVAGAEGLFEDDRADRIQFQRDGSGRVVAMNDSSGVHSHERVEGLASAEALMLPAALALLFTITTLLGFWRRWRQQPETTAAGRRASRFAFVGVLAVLTFVLLAVVAVGKLSGMSGPADLLTFPPTSLRVMSGFGWVLAAAALLLLVGLLPAWSGSGWKLIRKVNYSLFALSLAALCLQLYHWNVFGAPLI